MKNQTKITKAEFTKIMAEKRELEARFNSNASLGFGRALHAHMSADNTKVHNTFYSHQMWNHPTVTETFDRASKRRTYSRSAA